MKKYGFTLAEVLITLGIIGIVAEITIPVLMQNVQDQMFKTEFKKEYSTLNSVFTQLMNDNGGTLTGLPIYHKNFLNYMLPYLKKVKACDDWSSFADISNFGAGYTSQGCFYSYKYKLLNGNIMQDPWPDSAGVVLSDGSNIILDHNTTDCSSSPDITNSATIPNCASLLIDVNGFAKPNQIGRDIYGVWFLKDRVVPYGTSLDGLNNTCNSSSSGLGCAAVVLQN